MPGGGAPEIGGNQASACVRDVDIASGENLMIVKPEYRFCLFRLKLPGVMPSGRP